MISVEQRTISADEFWDFMLNAEREGKRFELVEGVIHEMPGGTGGDHGETTHQLGRLVGNHVADHHLGRMTAAETCYVLYKNPNGKDTVRCPDIGFVSIERAPKPLAAGYVPFAPDLAVEVVSPGNEASDMHNKVLDYLRYGTRLVWLVYPDSQTVVVYTKDGSNIVLRDDTLDGGDVLPDFSLLVRDIFPR
ncbi:MAG: Uma2 family endonuclease [Burkholderiales bacterium]|nr:Uma2 family endonuclease [Anaerolineae bacterium]